MQSKQAISNGALSEIVCAIYDCALAPSGWPTVLDMVRRELRFHNGVLQLFAMPGGDLLLNVTSGIDEPWGEKMAAFDTELIELWGGRDRIQRYLLDEPHVLSRVNPRGLSDRSRYATEWAEPQGIIDSLAIIVSRDSASLGSVAFGRHQSAGPIADRDIDGARLLIPHLQRTMTISRLLGIKTVSASTFEAVLDTVSVAVMLVDEDLGLVHANAAADRLLTCSNDPFIVKGGVLSCGGDAANVAMRTAVRQAAQDGCGLGGKGLAVPVVPRNGQPRLLHVLPLPGGDTRLNLRLGAAAAIFVAPAVARRCAASAALSSLFGLTPTEGRIVELMAAHLTNAEIADVLKIKVSTVKTHLIHVFEKTGTHRQAELTNLATSFGLPIVA